jgi:hypothetical protein
MFAFWDTFSPRRPRLLSAALSDSSELSGLMFDEF